MRTAQRGSVLLTAIAGILILAVIGTVMVSLMTSSVMTVVDGKETLQATYLAESGKEIVRAATAKLSGGALMEEAQKLEDLSKENGNKGLAVADKGFVKVSLYPSWFRWYDGKLNTTSSGWFPKVPRAKIELLMLSKNGANLYAYDAEHSKFGGGVPPSSEAGDVYLLGRVQEAIVYNKAEHTLTVTPSHNDLEFFPESGGLIGLVSKHQDGVMLPVKAQVSNLRFTYDRKIEKNGVYTFTNFTPLSDATVSQDTFKDKDIVLGQYFRVVCEATTANGARAALVWHTNGRSSLRIMNEGMEEGSEGTEVVSEDTLADGGKTVFKDNIIGNSTPADIPVSGKFHRVLNVQGLAARFPYHFLLPSPIPGALSTDFWFSGITEETIEKNMTQKEDGSDLIYQVTVFPAYGVPDFFGGLLFNTTRLSGSSYEKGAKGLGLGIVYSSNKSSDSVDPFLLPGYNFNNDITNEPFFNYYNIYGDFSLTGPTVSAPFVILWAYDDSYYSKKGSRIPSGETTLDDTQQAAERPLRWLAIGKLDSKEISGLWDPYCTTLAGRVSTQEGINAIEAWVCATPLNDFDFDKLAWPSVTSKEGEESSKGAYSQRWRKIDWMMINPAYAALDPKSNAVLTPFAVEKDKTRAGIFAGHYSASFSQPPASHLYFANFAVGIPGSGGTIGTNAGGLTPGITN